MRLGAHILIALAVMAGWSSHTANGQPIDGTHCSGAQDLLDFSTRMTSYPAIASCPRILVATDDALLSSIHFSDARYRTQPEAVYLPSQNSILISEDIDVEGPVGRSFLVHELVHALQFQGGVAGQKPCLGELEAEAYRVQSAYLAHEGLTRLSTVYRLYALAMASCAHAYHPDF